MRNRMMAASALLLGLALSAAPAGGAIAANHDGRCEYKEVCIYSNSYYSGGMADYRYWNSNYSGDYYFHTLIPRSLNDSASSGRNEDPRWTVRFFEHSNFRGRMRYLPPGVDSPRFSLNDTYSSHCWNDGSITCPTTGS